MCFCEEDLTELKWKSFWNQYFGQSCRLFNCSHLFLNPTLNVSTQRPPDKVSLSVIIGA